MAVSERFQGANMVDAGTLSPYWGEHAARYHFALEFVEKARVLDIACGTGYGTAILAETAKFVAGVDVDPEAAKTARKECGDKASILLASGLDLPFPDASFDVVTSFETLEHLHDRSTFVSELARILKPKGKLILSTPNAIYTQPVNGKPSNPFHVHEYTPDELREEIEQHFAIERLLGQTLDPSSGVPPFYEAQRRLPRDLATQAKLFGWKVMNKLPYAIRETASNAIWQKPFYPGVADYRFSADTVETAPVSVVVCSKPL